MVVAECQENESCSKALNSLDRGWMTELGVPMRRQLPVVKP